MLVAASSYTVRALEARIKPHLSVTDICLSFYVCCYLAYIEILKRTDPLLWDLYQD
jgi:hypothetical protein